MAAREPAHVHLYGRVERFAALPPRRGPR